MAAIRQQSDFQGKGEDKKKSRDPSQNPHPSAHGAPGFLSGSSLHNFKICKTHSQIERLGGSDRSWGT
jgi:hypothetical protein